MACHGTPCCIMPCAPRCAVLTGMPHWRFRSSTASISLMTWREEWVGGWVGGWVGAVCVHAQADHAEQAGLAVGQASQASASIPIHLNASLVHRQTKHPTLSSGVTPLRPSMSDSSAYWSLACGYLRRSGWEGSRNSGISGMQHGGSLEYWSLACGYGMQRGPACRPLSKSFLKP